MNQDLTARVSPDVAAPAGARTERVALTAFLAEAVLAGGNGVGIRISLRELGASPLWAAFLRFAFAAVLLLAVMAALRLAFPRGRALAGAVLYGLFVFGGAFGFAFYALVRIQAGFGQIVLALVPLATLLLAVAQRQERLRVAALGGTLLAFAGIAVMSQAPLRESVPVPYLLAALGSVLCFAQGTVLVRRFPPVHPVTMNAVGMTAGAAVLLAGTLIVGEQLTLPQRAATWAALGYLVGVGSIVVFWLYIVVLRYWAASRVAYGFVLTPIVTVMASAWLDGERITAALVFGGLLVMAGVYVGALRPARETAAADDDSASPTASSAPRCNRPASQQG
jgi:drug/metabolite transporter (DMT)-like permease